MSKQSFTTGQVLTAAQMTSLQQTAMLGGDASVKVANYTLVAADAGTAVAMNSASTTTITVNSGLFAAGDTVFIQNRGAGVCTVTAGTATVACAGSLALPQNDGGILYFTSASAATFYDFIQVGATSPLTTKGDVYVFGSSDTRLPVGTNGHVLTCDSTTSTGLKYAAPAAGAFVGCSLTKSANQSLSNNTSTAITFDGEKFDTDSFHDNSTNTSRITIPSGKGGYYLVTGTLKFTSSTTGVRRADLNKNGTLIQLYFIQFPNTGSDFTGSSFASIENLAVGDYIELFGLQSSGGALNVVGGGDEATRIQVQYLGA